MTNFFQLFKDNLDESDVRSIRTLFSDLKNFSTVSMWGISKPTLHKCLDRAVIGIKISKRSSKFSEIILTKISDNLYNIYLFDNKGVLSCHLDNVGLSEIVQKIDAKLKQKNLNGVRWIGY